LSSSTKKDSATSDTEKYKLIWHEPSGKQYGFFELHAALTVSDMSRPREIAVAVLNVVDDINLEVKTRHDAEVKVLQEAVKMATEKALQIAAGAVPIPTEPPAVKTPVIAITKPQPQTEQEKKAEQLAKVDAFLADPRYASLVAAKRTELGSDAVNEVTAAMIVMRELGMSHAEKDASTYVPATACPAMGYLKYYAGKFGWSAYIGQDKVGPVLAWLLSIPYEIRHRKPETGYPKIGASGKYLMVNDTELDFLKRAATDQNITPEEKESQQKSA